MIFSNILDAWGINDLKFDQNTSGVGCVFFDQSEIEADNLKQKPSKGWASINGEAAFRVSGVEVLNKNVVWITNINRHVFWKIGLTRYEHLRASDFFETELHQLMKEFGLNPKKIEITKICEVLSEIFSRSIRWSLDLFGLEGVESTLKETIFKKERKFEKMNLDDLVEDALMRAYTDVIEMNKEEDKARTLTLKLPRKEYIKWMCGEFPKGSWSAISMDEIENLKDWIINQEKPLLIKVKSRGFKKETSESVRNALNLGYCVKTAGRKRERDWMVKDEYLFYEKYMDLRVDGILEGEGWETYSKLEDISGLGELADLSLSLGLIAESYVGALESKLYHPSVKTKTYVTPLSLWINAKLRVKYLEIGVNLIERGLIIKRVENGIEVKLKAGSFYEMIKILESSGLSMPAFIKEVRV